MFFCAEKIRTEPHPLRLNATISQLGRKNLAYNARFVQDVILKSYKRRAHEISAPFIMSVDDRKVSRE